MPVVVIKVKYDDVNLGLGNINRNCCIKSSNIKKKD